MRELDRNVRFHVYEHFAQTGTPPQLEDISGRADCSLSDAEASLARLELEHHALALAPTTRNIWMAHPFSAVPTAFIVETTEVNYWANCAWDAVTIPSLLSLDATVTARCEQTREEMTLTFREGALAHNSSADGVVHFVVPPRLFWNNVGYT